MKKSLIALAALAAVGAASAQSSVTLYGVVDIGFGSQTTTSRDGSNTIRSRGVIEGSNASNRIGFRGTEDLGGGLKANFLVEQGISPTSPELFATRVTGLNHQVTGQPASSTGAFSTSTNRQTYVGLTSATIGTFNIGRQYTLADDFASLSGYNIGAENSVGSQGHLAGMLPGSAILGTRSNSIVYVSPNFGGGFVAKGQYGSGGGREVVESTNTLSGNGLTSAKERLLAVMLQYANGPLSAAAVYSNVRKQSANVIAGVNQPIGSSTNAFGVVTPGSGAVLTGQDRTGNLFQLGGSYDFGVAKIGGTYNTGKNGGTATSTVSSRVRAYELGVSAPFGAIVPFVAFGRIQTTPDGAARTEDTKQYQLGVRYSLSKRTTAYAIYGESRNDAAVGAAFYKDRKGSLGVAHAF